MTMKPKVSVFIATSLDGFIARPDDDLDWLDAAQATVPKDEDCGYQAFMQSVDMLVMGRRTFEKVLSIGLWPYGETPVTVMSSTAVDIPADMPPTVTHCSEAPATVCARLHEEGVRHVYVDGGNTIQRFLSAGLVDELTITLIPVLLGAGIRLFGAMDSDVSLECTDTRHYEFGLVQLQYRVKQDN